MNLGDTSSPQHMPSSSSPTSSLARVAPYAALQMGMLHWKGARQVQGSETVLAEPGFEPGLTWLQAHTLSVGLCSPPSEGQNSTLTAACRNQTCCREARLGPSATTALLSV